MSELLKIISSHINETLLDEDGNSLNIELRVGAVIEDVLKFEMRHGIKLPQDLKELLLFSNGVNLFGLNILSLEEIEVFPYTGILSFHNWGNGDFDCLSVGGDYPKGAVVFMDHSEDDTVLVSNSIVEWFEGVISEMKKIGTLLHPMDYNERKLERMHENISYKIDIINTVNLSDLEALFSNPSLQQAESALAAKMDCGLYEDNKPLLIGFVKGEVDASMLSISDIERFITNHSEEIVVFGQILLGNVKPEGICIGVAITYSVYMIYLKEKGEKELLEYLKRIRIPGAQKFLKQLLSIKKEMNL